MELIGIQCLAQGHVYWLSCPVAPVWDTPSLLPVRKLHCHQLQQVVSDMKTTSDFPLCNFPQSHGSFTSSFAAATLTYDTLRFGEFEDFPETSDPVWILGKEYNALTGRTVEYRERKTDE